MSGASFHGQIDDSNIIAGNNFQGNININIQSKCPKQHEACEYRQAKAVGQREGCAKSLAFPEIDHRFLEIDEAVEGTCSWIAQHEAFKSWIGNKRRLLWIKGKPGSGKSTLLKYTLRKFATELGKDDTVLLSFFFHGQGEELQKTLLGFYRTLLHQLLKDPLNEMDDLLCKFEEKSNNNGIAGKDWLWHERELGDIFSSSLLKVLQQRPVWLFVDALDECDEEAAVGLISHFEKWAQKLPRNAFGFKLCLSCRQYPVLDFGGGLEISLERENAKDIATFVQTELSVTQVDYLTFLQNMIVSKACGVFMWAHLVLKRVLAVQRGGEGLEKVMEEIERLPPGLDSLYTQLVEKMKGTADSLLLIQWVSSSRRPLTVEELRWAMAFNTDNGPSSLQQYRKSQGFISGDKSMERRIKTLSCGLVEVAKFGSHTSVQFIHQSAKDFFMEKGLFALASPQNAAISNDLIMKMTHKVLFMTCVRYLAMDEIALFLKRPWNVEPDKKPWEQVLAGCAVSELWLFSFNVTERFSFLKYSIETWRFHARESQRQGERHDRFGEHSECPLDRVLTLWLCGCSRLDRHSDVAYLMQNATLLEHILPSFASLPPGLVAGALNRLWLRLSPRQRISAVVLIKAMPLLLHEKKDQMDLGTIFLIAELGFDDGIRALLGSGIADLGWRSGEGSTLLSLAAKHGHEQIVEFLIHTGRVAINSRDNHGRTALLLAAKHGHKNVVEKLLQTGQTDVDSKDNYGHTPMSLAKAGRFTEIVQLLLDAGHADIDSEINDESSHSLASEAAWEWLLVRLRQLDEQSKIRVDHLAFDERKVIGDRGGNDGAIS